MTEKWPVYPLDAATARHGTFTLSRPVVSILEAIAVQDATWSALAIADDPRVWRMRKFDGLRVVTGESSDIARMQNFTHPPGLTRDNAKEMRNNIISHLGQAMAQVTPTGVGLRQRNEVNGTMLDMLMYFDGATNKILANDQRIIRQKLAMHFDTPAEYLDMLQTPHVTLATAQLERVSDHDKAIAIGQLITHTALEGKNLVLRTGWMGTPSPQYLKHNSMPWAAYLDKRIDNDAAGAHHLVTHAQSVGLMAAGILAAEPPYRITPQG